MRKFSSFYWSVLIVALLFITSCKNRTTTETDAQGNTVIKEWYNRKQVKSVKTILNQGLNDYVLISYDRNGKLLDSARYINDTLEGMRRFYEEKTTLLHIENYHNGFLNGIHKAIYNTGVTGFEGYRKNNKMVGEWKFNFADGHPITYEYYDSAGVMKYFRKYDDDGNVLRVDGIGMIQVKANTSSLDSIQIISGFVEAAVPPESTTIFTIENIREGKPQEIYLEMVLQKPKTVWEIKFTESGQKKLKYTITITDNKTGKKEESVSEQTIMVNPFK
jgi:antitoxin component YwqK of YwqJK toxin-antitoxin module